ncbi:MAG: GAF domain-containing protein [Cyanobacteria bacterium RM1_2_2]|nr:GAF domain-containing protein [Cyanobacteria bacterium RM1_2_2]
MPFEHPSPSSSSSFLQGQQDSFALLLHRMTHRIRQSLELSEILATTVVEVRAFLNTDRVKIYCFQADGSGEVIAESIREQRLPALLGHNFPAEDIPETARELFQKVRLRSIVDVARQQIGVSPMVGDGTQVNHDLEFRPVDPCHIEYLTAMGVQSSLVVPILDGEHLWGLLVSHHSVPRPVDEQELQVVQLVADQVSIAIAQSNLLQQTRQRAVQEATINRVTALLHTPEMQFQAALEQAVSALQGCGGRLSLKLHADQPQIFTLGAQPALPETWQSDPLLSSLPLEHHPHWQTWLDLEESANDCVWAVTDLYRAVMPSDLVLALLEAEIRGILIVRLQYRQETLGYLSIFRQEIDVERIWAGRIDANDPRQQRPRQSFETWRELKKGQANPWTQADLELAQALSHPIAVAIHQRTLYQQVCTLNSNLEQDIQRRKQAERKISALNAKLEQRVLARTNELQQANQELRWQIAERERVIAERQQAEALLDRLSHQNELILNSAGEGIYGLDLQGKITFANPAAARILGYEVEELIGQWMYGLLKHSKSDGSPYLLAENPICLTLQTGVMQHRSDDRFCHRDGSTFPVEYVSSPIHEQNKIVGAVVLFKDITLRQQVEQMKDEFVSIVSHELRTPLTSIRSTLGLLSSGWLNSYPEKSQRMLEIAFSNTNRLVRLINDVLDIERIKFGKVTMEKRLCNAADLMLQSVDTMRAMAEKAEVTLNVTPLSANLWADPDRIIQTFTNLLSNAIKFSPPHSAVHLSAEFLSDSASSSPESSVPLTYIRFCVQDQGIGIPADKLDTIFDRFQQIDSSTSRSQGGTGLGLTICRGIVQQHDGQVWVTSQIGQGSCFYVTLPLADHEQTHLDH